MQINSRFAVEIRPSCNRAGRPSQAANRSRAGISRRDRPPGSDRGWSARADRAEAVQPGGTSEPLRRRRWQSKGTWGAGRDPDHPRLQQLPRPAPGPRLIAERAEATWRGFESAPADGDGLGAPAEPQRRCRASHWLIRPKGEENTSACGRQLAVCAGHQNLGVVNCARGRGFSARQGRTRWDQRALIARLLISGGAKASRADSIFSDYPHLRSGFVLLPF